MLEAMYRVIKQYTIFLILNFKNLTNYKYIKNNVKNCGLFLSKTIV